MSVTDTDKGWKAIVRELKSLGGSSLTIGVQGNAGSHPSGLNMADVASFNEFGTSTAPARSFLRSTFDDADYYRDDLTRLARRVGKQLSARRALTILGFKITSDVKQKIVELKTPPNAPSTIAEKGSSNPLIDTGRLRQSIDFEIGKL